MGRRKKPKLDIDELLNAVESKDIQEFMTPVKPLKRKMHIKIVGFKDEKYKKKLAVKKNERIKEIIVDFNSANRKISKIKMIRGEIERLVALYRLKVFSEKFNSNKRTLNGWLNEIIYRTENVDYFALHERVFILRNDGVKRRNVGVVSIHFKDKLNIEKPYYMGDIVDIAACSTTHRIVSIKEVLDEVLRQFSSALPRIRLVANSRISHAIRGMTLKNMGWYRSHHSNGDIDGWFPRKVLARQNSAVRGSLAVLSTTMKEYYSRRITPSIPRRNRDMPYAVSEADMDTLVPAPRRIEMRAALIVELEGSIENAKESLAEEGHSAAEITIRVNEMIHIELMRRIRGEAERMSLRQAVHHDLEANGGSRISVVLARRLLTRERKRDIRLAVTDDLQDALIDREQELREEGYGDDIIGSEAENMIEEETIIRIMRVGLIERGRLIREYGETTENGQGNEHLTREEHASLSGSLTELAGEMERTIGRRRANSGDEQETTDEELYYRNLPSGTVVIVRHGNGRGRSVLGSGRTRCTLRGGVDDGWYNADFEGYGSFSIEADEIVEVVIMGGSD